MAYGNRQPRISTDRFGNAYQLITLHQAENKKTGEMPEGCYKGYIELGGKLYKIEISPREKETKKGTPAVWCKVTKTTQRQRQTSM